MVGQPYPAPLVGTPERSRADLEGCNHTLRTLRVELGLSLRQVELATGINRATLSKVERGIEVPRPDHMIALSELYGVPVESWRLAIEYRTNQGGSNVRV